MAIKGVSPYLRYDDADAALDWMERVLGFTGTIRWLDYSGRTFEADIHGGAPKIGVSGGGGLNLAFPWEAPVMSSPSVWSPRTPSTLTTPTDNGLRYAGPATAVGAR
ncbi:hypothetical protein ACFWSF_30500 [Streptomyces sp. NPDC058611]|uniref:hypothetical protein n=1 Tax=unclassified Streptomyces TaxID=2593676 RepID=UPI0036654BF9